LAVDIDGSQADRLGDAQPGGVAGGKDGAMLEAGHAVEKLPNLFRTEYNRQFLGFLRGGDDVFHGPMLVKCDLVEETQGGHGDEDGTGSQLLFVGRYTW
jgi:hypothetical protein